jgi:RNA polymerase sigma-70 factor (ECF subfamily)
VTAPDAPRVPDAGEVVERAEDVSLAMLVVLETLSPLERAVFILKEVFGYPYPEIAGMLDRGEAAVRQVGSRARSHVQARRPRYDAPAEVRRKATDEFLAACLGGDLNEMMALLAPDVTAWTDGGGRIRAALRPLNGPENVCRWLLGVLGKYQPGHFAVHPADVNGRPGYVFTAADTVDSVLCADIDENGAITALRLIRNPEKLSRVRV